jgi:dynein heavy chain
MCVQINRFSGEVQDSDWMTFLKGVDSSRESNIPANPVDWLPNSTWQNLYCAPAPLNNVARDLMTVRQAETWKTWFASFESTPCGLPIPESFQGTLFQQLFLRSVFNRQCTVFAIKEYVGAALGPEYTKSPPFDLESVYEASDPETPIVFVLSSGANPMEYILKLSQSKGRDEKSLHPLSLGQGQGPRAEELMVNGRRNGDWVVLENCHLSVSWMPFLEHFLDVNQGEEVHEGYRLFLTSMPSKAFPIAILQNGVKVTKEPPLGLANNLRGTFLEITQEEYDECSNARAFKKLFFGLAFFHATIQERRRFGAIGWNIPYEWMNSDLTVSKMQLKLYLDGSEHVPFETLRELIGEVNYAGRVTDSKDQVCVSSMLMTCLSEDVLHDDYKFTSSDAYYPPSETATIPEVLEYIESLPGDTPGAFGLHQNANITFQLQETQKILSTLLSMQPRSSSAGGTSNDTIITELAQSMVAQIPPLLDRAAAHPSVFAGLNEGTNTLGVFFGQELDRFNKLLTILRKNLVDLQDAIKGTVVMSAAYELMYNSMLVNEVPEAWGEDIAWPSMKNLRDWFEDTLKRVAMMSEWLLNGVPKSFWISGFFFPQGFLTAVLQKYARKHHIPIDTLRFRSHVMRTFDMNDLPEIKKGAYVHGAYLQGAGWDIKAQSLLEPTPGELFQQLPVIWLEPETIDMPEPTSSYACPCYKTSRRAGTLSTTGHSTNFVTYIDLPSITHAADHWVRRGTALLLCLDTNVI